MNSFDIVTYIKSYSFDELSDEDRMLIDCARQATEKAYAPYSNYFVGAAIMLEDSTIIIGNNQENAAYPSGLCAERVAIFQAGALHPDKSVKTIAIIARNNSGFTDDICSPCGACRQVILETENRYKNNIRILMCAKDKVYEVESVKALLPLHFSNEKL
ncbi:cytidine deaminase [Dysgonomonas sp. 216]|uniref:cytidine deaminase n=1 Tax=Dysgonomonas sp. 216 TaxID=2302934 RepID=UPI0013D6DC9D|nr:cytidine deaminase [Dysgonomonas sp. 216]NDW17912.1 cytidine deaminase [Dysgonomonas sp. 216]